MFDVKHPEVSVRLVGEDGNAFAIMGRVSKAMKAAGLPKDEINAYMNEAMSGDYDNLLRTTMQWVACDADLDDYIEED